MPVRCAVMGCSSKVGSPEISFYRCPKDIERCEKWKCILNFTEGHKYAKLTAEECYSRIRVCNLHFSTDSYTTEGKSRLRDDAIPSVLLPACNSMKDDYNSLPSTSKIIKQDSQTQTNAVLYKSEFTQTTTELTARTPRKVQLRKRVHSLEKQVMSSSKKLALEEETGITLNDVLHFIDKNYSEAASKLLKGQLLLLNKAPKGSRYSDELKQFALSVYFLGPKAYKKISSILRLPSKSTLYRFTKGWIVETGFNDFIFHVLKLKVDHLQDKAKDCFICLDEISLKSHLFYNISKDKIVGFQEGFNSNENSTLLAGSALTVMIRGIASSWKLPIAYFFYKTTAPNSDLKNILFSTVQRCKAVGLNILGVVSDQGSNFQKLATVTLGISENNPFFYVGDIKLVYLFDIPHLLKSTRNNFFSYKFILPEGVSQKSYLEQVYNYEKHKQFKLAPKLTSDHIYPNGFQKMKVKLATQVFSHSVAVAMHTYIEFGLIPEEAKTTANFIQKINDFFDLLNSSSFEKFQAFRGTEKQLTLLQEVYDLFDQLKVFNYQDKNVTKRLKFISGWKITIKAVISLWETLKTRGYTFLFTRNLDQDCLENFFGQIRNCCGNSKNPTPTQFCSAFKKLFSVKYFDHFEGTNCMDDVNEVLLSIGSELNKERLEQFTVPTETKSVPLKVFTTDYQNLSSPEGNALVYVTGYLLKKCLVQHSCDTCLNFAHSADNLIKEETFFCRLKAYTTKKFEFGGLLVPSRDIVENVIGMENIFIKKFNFIANQKGIGQQLMQEFLKLSFDHPCNQFPFKYYVSLYTRVRIYFTLKFILRDLNANKLNKSYKPNSKLSILEHS